MNTGSTDGADIAHGRARQRDQPPLRRQRRFVLLWVGEGVSEFASQITTVALPLLAVLVLHVSAAEFGLLSTALWLPWLTFALVIGNYVDHHRRRPLLIAADLGRAVLLSTVAGLAWAGALTISALAVLMFALGSLTVLFEVTYQSFVPSVVAPSQLLDANARLQATASVAQVGGPSVAGVIVGALSAPAAVLVNGVAYLVSASTLVANDATKTPCGRRATDGGLVVRVREGLALTYRNPVLRSLVGVAATYNLFNEWILTLFVLYAVHQRHLSATELGLVLASGAGGAIIGSLPAGVVIRAAGLGRTLLASVILECVALAFVPLVGGSPLPATVELAALFAANGIGVAQSSVAAVSLRQATTPPELLGRMTASYRCVSYGAVAMGAAVGGVVGQLVGLRPGLIIAAIGLLSTIGWVRFSPLPHLRTLSDAASQR